jgi:hypothetical protein
MVQHQPPAKHTLTNGGKVALGGCGCFVLLVLFGVVGAVSRGDSHGKADVIHPSNVAHPSVAARVSVEPSAAKPSASEPPSQSGVHLFLPRLHKVTGIDALSAYCRNMYYAQTGSTVKVRVVYQGPGDVSVSVFPAPGDGTNERDAEAVVGSQESSHGFVFRHVIGKVDHVQVMVTANRGVDECFARRES